MPPSWRAPLPRLLALAWAAGIARGELSPPYRPPDLTTPVFDASQLSLETPVRARLATLLAAVVSEYDATLDAKILGIALRLDPANRAALAVAERRRKGDLPDELAEKPPYPRSAVSAYLAGQSFGLRTRGGPDNITLAGYLNDLAAAIDPANEIARNEKGLYRKKFAPPAWTFLADAGAKPPEPAAPLKRESKILGLGISELPNGEETGGVMEILVTADEARTRQQVGIAVAQEIGASMKTALDEALRAVKLRHPGFGERQHFTLSFGEKYGAKDGPSAGAAFTLLLYSLYDPLKLAGDCAITGDITVDGRVRKVGAVPSKIHAAVLDQCRLVAIPRENAETVNDTALLYAPNTLWKTQVFTVDTLDQALDVMREDRPANLQAAVERFAAIQRAVGRDAPALTRANAGLIPALQEVLRLAPNHASAAYMLRALQGKAPAGLSLGESLGAVQRITQATLNVAAPRPERREIDRNAIAEGLARLEALQPRLDDRITELCLADMAGLRALQKMDASSPPAPAQLAEYRRQMTAIRDLQERMANDRALIEALQR